MFTSQAREAALVRRHEVRKQELSEHTKALGPLAIGAVVQVQKQAGPHRNKWDHSGTVVEVLGHDAYHVKMDGSGRVTKHNRRFLRQFLPYTRVLAEGQKDTVDNSVLGTGTTDNDSNSVSSGAPVVGPGGASGSAGAAPGGASGDAPSTRVSSAGGARLGVDSAGGTNIRGTG